MGLYLGLFFLTEMSFLMTNPFSGPRIFNKKGGSRKRRLKQQSRKAEKESKQERQRIKGEEQGEGRRQDEEEQRIGS